MQLAAGLDTATLTGQRDEMTSTPVPWRTIQVDGGRVDVQVLESGSMGRRLLIVEYDRDDGETERRILAALGVLVGAG